MWREPIINYLNLPSVNTIELLYSPDLILKSNVFMEVIFLTTGKNSSTLFLQKQQKGQTIWV
jgi:hypothetical protein